MEKNHPQLFTDVRQKEFDTTDRMKHYFAYRHYDNISEFYDSHRFLRAEKRFRFMTKMDLKNCFENIYPEDLSKALFDMPMEQAVGSLAEAFCQLQRDFTENEKGIVIGPEFSRIYAEMIMQKVEIGLEKELLAKGLALHKDYQYYRYVDDVFLFYNDDETGKAFKQVYEKELGKFHQTINEDKLVTFTERPFVEPMAVVKAQFRQLVNEIFENRLDTFKGFVHAQQGQYDLPMSVDYKTFINKVRVLIAASRHEGKTVTYDKLTPFLLSCIQTHLEKLLIDFNSLYREYSMADKEQEINAVGETTFNKYKEGFVEFACELTRIIFFLLASDFRMNTSKRAMATINRLQLYVKGMYYFESLNEYSSKFPVTYISRLDHLISDETAGLLKSTSSGNMHSMEMLNLLELQKSMSQSDRISARTLSNYLAGNGKPENAVVLNIFTAMELLHFAENNPAYHEISKRGFEWMERKTEELQMPGKSDTESVLALLEILCCPWVKDEIKGKWSRKLCSQRAEGLVHFANSQKELFVKWRDYRLQEELQHTNSSEVY
jgi:hypothetical protein